MIKRIYDGVPERLTDSYYGKKILAAYLAYGGKYEFCRFYACDDGNNSGTIHIYNSAMVIDGICSSEDINFFVEMIRPFSIEASGKTPLHLPDGYIPKHRTLFMGIPDKTGISSSEIDLNSSFEACYGILSESFENFGSFDEWYVDISHRIRHGVSGIYLWKSTVAIKNFDIDGFAFVSGICTAAKERGKGDAGKFLKYLASEFEKKEKKMFLFALDNRKTFYQSIGSVPIDEDILYEWKV